MTAIPASLPGRSPSGVSAMLRDLQRETMLWTLPVLSIAGFVLILSEDRFREPLQAMVPGVVLLLWPALVWLLRRRNYLVSAWTLVGGCLFLDLLFVAWGDHGAALSLLALPTGLAALFVGMAGGICTALACTLLLVVPAAPLPVDPALKIATLIGVWGTVGLMRLAVHPLFTALQWSWSSCEQSRRLLEQARDYQVQLKQTLVDLADANMQLTRLNHLAQGLRQAAEEARRAKEQFVANVSHELRTPLNMVIGFSEMILKAPRTYGKISPKLLADLAVILRNSQHLSALIDDVLDLSQIEAGRMALTRQWTALAELVEGAAIAVRPLFESKGLYLEVDVPADAMVFCDGTRIREVVLNLLSNAGRFTDQGGVHIRAWREGANVVVSVADTGPGIGDADKDRLFQPFQQLDGSLRRRYGGSGLGLSISKSFVELHGGRMWFESQIGSGTTFYFSLPTEPPTPTKSGVGRWFNPYWHYEERTHPSLAPAPVVRPRFVVLEEGNTLQRLLARYLDKAEIVHVATFDEAARELASLPVQAFLVNGPSVNDALQRVKLSTLLPESTPAIVCALCGPDDALDGLAVAGYLVKPVSRDLLLTTLERLPLPGKTILVVDDDLEVLQLFWRMLDSADRGYRVLTASDGQQALDTLRTQRPDVMLLDLGMPEMDGFRLLELRANDPLLCDIPVIIISARDPAGQPIVSDALGVTCGGGLSVPQLLACIEVLSGVLATTGQVADRAPRGNLPG